MAHYSRKFFNRELSWLEFNQRVLEEACDPSVPLLERLKFLAISSSNLDEFFMVRVGGLQLLAKQGMAKADPSGMTPREQLEAICQRTHQMVEEQYQCYTEDIEPALAQAGVRRVRPGELSERQSRHLAEIFEDEVFSVLTPATIGSPSEFPLIGQRMVHVAVRLKGEVGAGSKPRFAIIPLGQRTERFVTLPSDSGYEYMLLEDVVGLFVDFFFPGQQIMECAPFRITRNADLAIQEDMAGDLLAEMEDLLDERKRSDSVRLEVVETATQTMLSFLQRSLRVKDEDIYSVPGPLDFASFMSLAGLRGFEGLKYEVWPPQPAPGVEPAISLFQTLAAREVLLLHPFETFEPVVRLVEEAADDPNVLAIKQILYRTSRDSPIVAALTRAAEKGKYVTVIVELKARFDEARNIEWARSMEEAGVQVIYGVKGLKTHAKVCIVIRREPAGIRRYVHFGTGNYNESTARLYGDISYLTCQADLGADASSFFNAVTGYSHPRPFRQLRAAPLNLREAVLEMIQAEIERKRQGQAARITAKLNSLVDPMIINALYEASRAGIEVRLNVRGICCLRPGVKNQSENIRVISIVDRFLEHARAIHFHHGGDDVVLISSADWMPRNLDRRVELLVPVNDPESKRKIIEALEIYFADNVKARELRSHGNYTRLEPASGATACRSQEVLYRKACDAASHAEQIQRTEFEPYRPTRAEA